MKLKNIRPVKLLIYFLIAMIWPVIRWITVENNKWLAATDAATVVGLILIALGIIVIAVLHGDYDITEYALMRIRLRRQAVVKSFDAFKNDKEEEREGSFNYPLLTGIVMLILSIIASRLL